ncbi:MAG: hypothetical protein JSW08_01525 [archaeon]|nr:MAG: hypothetical protein JSW08_01525 [archaeon]
MSKTGLITAAVLAGAVVLGGVAYANQTYSSEPYHKGTTYTPQLNLSGELGQLTQQEFENLQIPSETSFPELALGGGVKSPVYYQGLDGSIVKGYVRPSPTRDGVRVINGSDTLTANIHVPYYWDTSPYTVDDTLMTTIHARFPNGDTSFIRWPGGGWTPCLYPYENAFFWGIERDSTNPDQQIAKVLTRTNFERWERTTGFVTERDRVRSEDSLPVGMYSSHDMPIYPSVYGEPSSSDSFNYTAFDTNLIGNDTARMWQYQFTMADFWSDSSYHGPYALCVTSPDKGKSFDTSKVVLTEQPIDSLRDFGIANFEIIQRQPKATIANIASKHPFGGPWELSGYLYRVGTPDTVDIVGTGTLPPRFSRRNELNEKVWSVILPDGEYGGYFELKTPNGRLLDTLRYQGFSGLREPVKPKQLYSEALPTVVRNTERLGLDELMTVYDINGRKKEEILNPGVYFIRKEGEEPKKIIVTN